MSIKINIIGDGLSFEFETNLQKAGQIITFLSNETVFSSNSASAASSKNDSFLIEKPKISPRDILISSGARTNAEKITALGKYVMERDNTASFSTRDIKEILKKIGESVPGNFSRDLREAKRLNYIYDADGTELFSVTETGDSAVSGGFKNAVAQQSVKPQKKKSKGGQSNTLKLREEVKLLEINPLHEMYGNYWKNESKGMKIMWLLAYVLDHKIDDLSAREIEFLSNKLRDNIAGGNVPALSKANIHKGFILVTNSGNYKILMPGINKISLSGADAESND